MGANNPLLVVNNKVSLKRPPVERVEDRRPVIEGTVEVSCTCYGKKIMINYDLYINT